MNDFEIRAMSADDMAAVLDIQARCHHAAKQESAAAFLAKLAAAPGCSFIAWRDGTQAVGYLAALPALLEAPPRLHSTDGQVPPQPDCLYLHDMAVAPEARGGACAQALVEAFFAQQQRLGLRHASLTAINGRASYWQRFGFSAREIAGDALGGYGASAVYMTLTPARAAT